MTGGYQNPIMVNTNEQAAPEDVGEPAAGNGDEAPAAGPRGGAVGKHADDRAAERVPHRADDENDAHHADGHVDGAPDAAGGRVEIQPPLVDDLAAQLHADHGHAYGEPLHPGEFRSLRRFHGVLLDLCVGRLRNSKPNCSRRPQENAFCTPARARKNRRRRAACAGAATVVRKMRAPIRSVCPPG